MFTKSRARPIGQLLRSTKASKPSSSLSKSSLLSIDEQIALLEKSVAESISGDDFSDNEDSMINSEKITIVESDPENQLLVEKDNAGNVIRILSALDKDKIAPLPKEKLPGLRCSTTKKYSRLPEDGGRLPDDRSKRARFSESHQSTFHPTPISSSSSFRGGGGLETTVRELIRQYEPASIEKRPLYCRVCKYQASDLEDFESHKGKSSHLEASDLERKASFCKLCRKQFTSPDQLKDHLKGKGHIEKLEKAKEYNQSRKKFS